MNQLQSMRTFIEVVERASFSKAAHALHLSRATVSEQIADLEQHLGTTLLNRTTRLVSATDEGEDYYTNCKRILGELRRLDESLGSGQATPRGRLIIEAPESGVQALLMPSIETFQHQYPAISLHFVQSHHLFDITQSHCDVMIRTLLSRPQDSALIARPLGFARSVFAASPAYLAKHGIPKEPRDLFHHQCIGFIDPLTNRLWEWFFEQRGGKQFSLVLNHKLAFSSGAIRRDAAMRGLGIINDVSYNIQEALEHRKLKLILTEWSHFHSRLYVLYQRQRPTSRKVMTFVNLLVSQFPAKKELLPP